MGYAKATLVGFGFLGGVKVYAKALTLLKVIILARILSPSDLGMYGLAMIVLALVEVFTETGINQYLVQSSKNLSRYLSTAWVTSLIRGAGISFILLLLAMPLSIFYREPELWKVLACAALIPLIRGGINPAIVSWQKDLRFRVDAGFRAFLLTIESLIGIWLATMTGSAIGLIAAVIVSVALETIFTLWLVRPRPQLQFRWPIVKEVISFGRWHNLNGIFSYLGQTMDDLIVGRILGTGALGYYQAAFNMAQTSTNDVSDSAAQSLFPVLSKLREDRARFKKAIQWTVIPTAIVLGIGGIVFSVYATPIVHFVLGDKWLPAVPVLPWMLAAGWLQSVNNMLYPTYLAQGEPKHQLPVHAVYLFVMLCLILPLTTRFGLVGAGMSLLGARLVVQPVAMYRFWRAWVGWK